MAFPFSGNISGTVLSQSQDLPMVVTGFSLVNKEAGAVTVNVYLIRGANQVCMMPLNKSISSGSNYESTREFVMLATQQLKIQTTGSVDYDFLIDNTQAPEVAP